MVAALAYLPFRVVYAPTKLVGRVVAWLAEGYRSAPLLERMLIFPSWAVFRGLFIVGWSSALVLHAAAQRAVAARRAPAR
jgi:hypothetical protein